MQTAAPAKAPSRSARVIAVTSGKGGVGKTNLAVSLSIALTDMGHRVTLMDMDLGLGNVDILLNISPEHDLGDVVAGRMAIEDVVIETPLRLKVVPGVSGDEHLANLKEHDKKQLINVLEHLCYDNDFVIIDTGAGIARNTTMFTTSADEVIVVTTPEPTSMMDAYASIKTIKKQSPDTMIHLLVNMARGEKEARAAIKRMSSIASHFIGGHLEEDGFVLFDESVAQAVRKRHPFILHDPLSQPSRAILNIARTLVDVKPEHHVYMQAHQPGFLTRLLRAI